MLKRISCVLLAALLLCGLCACDVNFTGSTLILERYPADKLLKQFELYRSGQQTITFPINERIPELEGFIQTTKGVENAPTVKYCITNKGYYDVVFYGSVWVCAGEDHAEQRKAKYYNTEKKVSNGDYEIRLDPDHSCNFIYALTDDPVTMTDNTIVFFFFHFDESDYVAALDYEDNLFYWPLSLMKAETESK